jgi:hypothetical protein
MYVKISILVEDSLYPTIALLYVTISDHCERSLEKIFSFMYMEKPFGDNE